MQMLPVWELGDTLGSSSPPPAGALDLQTLPLMAAAKLEGDGARCTHAQQLGYQLKAHLCSWERSWWLQFLVSDGNKLRIFYGAGKVRACQHIPLPPNSKKVLLVPSTTQGTSHASAGPRDEALLPIPSCPAMAAHGENRQTTAAGKLRQGRAGTHPHTAGVSKGPRASFSSFSCSSSSRGHSSRSAHGGGQGAKREQEPLQPQDSV